MRPVEQSRFVQRHHPTLDGWSFLHALFQEFLASQHWAKCSEPELLDHLRHSLRSQTLQLPLAFFAGNREVDFRLWRTEIEAELADPDLFGVMLLRLGQLAIQGYWRELAPELTNRIFHGLWRELLTSEHWGNLPGGLDILARLDQPELLNLAAQETRVDAHLLEALCNVIPAADIRNHPVYRRLPPSLQEVLKAPVPMKTAREELIDLGRHLRDLTVGREALLKTIDYASRSPDPDVAEALWDRLRGETNEEVGCRLISALAESICYLPAHRLVEILFLKERWQFPAIKMAIALLRHRTDDGRKLNPESRDYLIGCLAAMPPSERQISPLLMALRGFPIRDGGELLLQFIADERLGLGGRKTVCQLMNDVNSPHILALLGERLEIESENELRYELLEVLMVRQGKVRREWIEQQLLTESSRIALGSLWSCYLQHVADDDAGNWREVTRQAFCEVMSNGEEGSALSSDVLLGVLQRIAPQNPLWKIRKIYESARDLLQAFSAKQRDASPFQLGAAVLLLQGFPGTQTTEVLEKSIRAMVNYAQQQRIRSLAQAYEAQAELAADRLAALNPERLLHLLPNCPPAERALRRRCWEHGWLVYGHRIFGADGREIATLATQPVAKLRELTWEGANNVCTDLPATAQKAILSAWLAVRAFQCCKAGDSDKNFYHAIQKMRNGGMGEKAQEVIRDLYETSIPPSSSWRTYLNRAVKTLQRDPRGRALLDELGLPRRKRKSAP